MVEEVSVTSWFSRLKDAMVGLFVGLAFLIGAIVLLFWNEQNSIHTLLSLEQTQKNLVSVPNSPVSDQNNGKVVYFNGMAVTPDTLEDSDIDLSLNAISLHRLVEMYQWQEHKETKKESQVGGSEKKTTKYTYEQVWSEELIDSSQFKNPEGHKNPSSMPITSEKQYAETVNIGAFYLPESLIKDIKESKSIKLNKDNADKLQETVDGTVTVVGNTLYVGENSQTPVLGDMRITVSAVYPQNVSVIGRQVEHTVDAYLPPAGEPVLLLASGIKSPEVMIHDAIADSEMNTWLLRLGSLTLLMLGFYLLVNPIVILADILPFLGSVASFGAGLFAFFAGLSVWITLTAIAWFVSRPLYSIGGISIVIALVFLLRKLKAKQSS
ncbi:MAG: TMEM43 family protein [Legionella sp.]